MTELSNKMVGKSKLMDGFAKSTGENKNFNIETNFGQNSQTPEKKSIIESIDTTNSPSTAVSYKGKIELSKSTINNKKEELADKNASFNNYISQLIRIKEGLTSSWKGDDASSFSEYMEVLIKDLSSYHDLIDSYIKYLGNVGDVFEQVDEIYARKKI